MTGMAELMSPAAMEGLFGVTIGIVTNNKDPDGLGRVKVQFPWLSATEESAWARVVSPMAGQGRGLYCLPEINDEVLVAFDHGQMEFPYILGALWNGKDKPPLDNTDGKNNQRLLRSKSGHEIRLDDSEDAAHIQIVDSSGNNSITITTQGNTIAIKADGDITVEAGGDVGINQGKKGAARLDDKVKVTIPIGTFVDTVVGQATATKNLAPVTVEGVITSASTTVKIGN